MNNFTPGELFEFLVLGIIIVFQFYFFVIILAAISRFKQTFRTSSKVVISEDNQAFIDYSGKNNLMISIVFSINNYLNKNTGGVVDFHILKDIVDRNIDNEDDQISSKISTPLYLGLVGTMVGIVIGLWNIDLSIGVETSSLNETLDISPLIDGVKWAMSVSVLGLFLTTYLSVWNFRKAKNIINNGKHEFLSLMQTDLLPSIVKSEGAAMQELSRRLNHFSSRTPDYIESLTANTKGLTEGIEKELSIIREIQKLDIKRISTANVEIFSTLGGMMDKFKAFPRYYNKLNDSLANTIELNKNLGIMVSRTEDVSAILNEVRDIIETSSEATTFFNAHIQSFEKYGDAVNQSVAITDQKMQDAIGQLGEAVTKQFETFTVAVTGYDKKLREAFEHSIEEFNRVYKESVPKFEQLSHLSSIDNKLDNTKTLLTKVDSLKSSIDIQNELLKNFEVSLPSDLNLNLKEKKGTYYYLKEGLTIITATTIIGYIALELINYFKLN